MELLKLKAVRDLIAVVPEPQIDMSIWAKVATEEGDIAWLDDHPDQLPEYTPECGTVACLAGWACTLFKDEIDPKKDIEDNARIILGLTHTEAKNLFTASGSGQYLGEITKDDLLKALDEVIDSGGEVREDIYDEPSEDGDYDSDYEDEE